MKKEKIFIAGYAKLPEGITAEKLYEVIAVGLVVEKLTGKILDAEVTLPTTLGRSFSSELLIGENLDQIEKIENKFKSLYYGASKKAIISSLKVCYKKYKEITKTME